MTDVAPSVFSGVVQALEHPLPAGLRDLLPAEARQQLSVAREVTRAFELYGYQRVAVPAFEYSAVLEQGLGRDGASTLLRFVEPETGEVVALRPDMTPQVARLVATRMRDVPGPLRLSYQGSVLRRRHERARQRRQITQVGFELIGANGLDGDLEVLELTGAALRRAGLDQFTLDLAHAQIAASLLNLVVHEARTGLVDALSMKDSVTLKRLGQAAGMDGKALNALAELPMLHGQEEVWEPAERVLVGTPAHAPMLTLKSLWQRAKAQHLAPDIVVDLGETWDLEYYTGTMFQILADGPGEPVGSGGRYDGLLERFGLPRPAAGFGVDLSNLCWALNKSGRGITSTPRVLVAGSERAQAESLLSELRRSGIAAAHFDTKADGNGTPVNYAQALNFDWIIEFGGEEASLERVLSESGKTDLVTRLSLDVDAIVGAVASHTTTQSRN